MPILRTALLFEPQNIFQHLSKQFGNTLYQFSGSRPDSTEKSQALCPSQEKTLRACPCKTGGNYYDVAVSAIFDNRSWETKRFFG